MTAEETKLIEGIAQAIAALNSDASDPGCTEALYAGFAYTHLREEVRPILLQLGISCPELVPVPQP